MTVVKSAKVGELIEDEPVSPASDRVADSSSNNYRRIKEQVEAPALVSAKARGGRNSPAKAPRRRDHGSGGATNMMPETFSSSKGDGLSIDHLLQGCNRQPPMPHRLGPEADRKEVRVEGGVRSAFPAAVN